MVSENRYNSNSIKISKQFKKMMHELKKKGFYKNNSLLTCISAWYPQVVDGTDYRFRMLPDIYNIVEKYFDEKHAPFVMEVLYMMDSWCYRYKYDNLIGLFIVDLATINASGASSAEEAESLVGDKLEIMSVAFRLQCSAGKTDAVGLLQEADVNYHDIYELSCKMHGTGQCISNKDSYRNKQEVPVVKGMEYFDQIIEPLIKAMIEKGAYSEYFEGFESKVTMEFTEDECKAVADKLHINDTLDEAVVYFLIQNILRYVCMSDCYCYNPFWIFGSVNYKMLMERVWNYEY